MPCQNLLRFLNYKKFKEETGGEIADFDALEQENKEKSIKEVNVTVVPDVLLRTY